jgi:ankyrin repeat protein
MQSRTLPARPHLDHLKNEAKRLHKLLRAGDADALRRSSEAIGEASAAAKLTDAQRIIAREYGFPTWARLRSHVMASGAGDVAAFLAAIQDQDLDTARAILVANPSLTAESLHAAAAVGDAAAVRNLIEEDPAQVRAKAGKAPADPLLWLCFSPFHGQNAERDAGFLESARLLLAAGADPNTVDGKFGVSALYGVTGQRSVIPIAKLLLGAGANPTDGESLHHAAENNFRDVLELLVAHGADLDATGAWGNTPLYFLTRWYNFDRYERARGGFEWLLAHGADPNVRCGPKHETALHAAVWRGQPVRCIGALLDHGADGDATRLDGRTPWTLAMRGGFDDIAWLLEQRGGGAYLHELSPADLLLGACGRGDIDDARRRGRPGLVKSLAPEDLALLPDAAAAGRQATVEACLAAGFPVDAVDEQGATAVHHAAISGRADIVKRLIAAGAKLDIIDPQHDAPPLGWACFGADFIRNADGDYPGVVRLLLEAGVRPTPNDHQPQDAGVRSVLAEYR